MSSNTPINHLWLDCLEPEVLTHIAAHLSADPNSPSALSLAETSPIQCKAVLDSLSHTLRFTNANSDHSSRWTRIARDTIQTVSFLDQRIIRSPGNFSAIPVQHNPLSLMQAPSIRRVEIFDEVPMLEALRASPTVKQLLIILEGRAPIGLIASVIKSLKLCKLELHCNVMAHACPVAKLTAHDISSSTVTSLHTVCHSPHHDDVLLSYIPRFPNLVEVTVNTQNPSNKDNEIELYRSLGKMTSVKIKYAMNSFELALGLGHRVTCLHMPLHRPLTCTQLIQLHACSAIQDLSIQVEHGTENALYSMLGRMGNLAALELSFAKPPYFNKQNHGSITTAPYVNEVTLIAALSMVNTPRLRQLQFVDSIISAGGMTKIICSMGSRLNLFSLPILYQNERPLERLALVLQALITHCPNLQSFSCREFPTALTKGNLGNYVNDETRNVQILLNKLRMRVPSLRCELLEKAIESLDRDPYGEPFVTPIQSQIIDSENSDDAFTDNSTTDSGWSVTDDEIQV